MATLIQLAFWVGLFSKLARHPTTGKQTYGKGTLSPVSIIICAKNEAANLSNNLPYIISQEYPLFEIIVVNDDSTDNTGMVLSKFASDYSNVRIIRNSSEKENHKGKKAALTKGIAAARFDLLLLTDADCRPNSPKWLFEMQEALYRNKADIGLGYGPYYEAEGWLNKFIRFDTTYTAIQYFSFALAGMPYMGVGRNLIYRKSVFHQVGGFTKHKHIASGDDDLFINEAAQHYKVVIIIKEPAFVYSTPKKKWREFYRQKSRHLTTGVYYKVKTQAYLGLLALSHFVHYLGGFVLILKFSTIFVLFIYVVRICIVFYYFGIILKKLREPALLRWIPFLDAAYVLYYVIFAPVLFFGKKDKWN